MNLYPHQQQAVDKALVNKGVQAFFHDVGCGKTRAALALYEKLRETTPTLKLLIVCPISLIESSWRDEINKYNEYRDPPLISYNLRSRPKHIDFFEEYDIYLINYEMLRMPHMYNTVSDLVKKFPTLCVADESSKFKNHRTQIAKTMIKLSKLCPYRVILSATPSPNSELELWPQIKFLSEHALMQNFFAFRNTFFHLERNGQIMQGQYMSPTMSRELFAKGWRYSISAAKREELIRRISSLCHRVRKDEVLADLPEQIDQVRYVKLSVAESKAYREMSRHLVSMVTETAAVSAPNALTKLTKLRQITSGFLIDEDGEHVHQIGQSSSKTTELLACLEEIGAHQTIIWCEYRHEIREIAKLLGKQCVTLYGETQDKQGSIEQFQSHAVRYLIAHPASASHGLNLQNASYSVFYSLSYSWEHYEQCRGRIHRSGQRYACTYVHLLCPDTLDTAIYETLQRKGCAQDIILGFLNQT